MADGESWRGRGVMCYAIPGRVDSIEGKRVVVDYFGEKKKAFSEIPLKVGDYIYAQGGYVLTKVSDDEALSVLDVWKDAFFELQDVDVRLSKMQSDSGKSRVSEILDRATQGIQLKRDELLHLLKSEVPDELELIYRSANFIRHKHMSNSCCVHGIIEFSNVCRNSCHYCGISSSVDCVNRYSMNRDEIIEAADIAVNRYGFKALVLQSGESDVYGDELAGIVREIRSRFGVLIFISCGEVGLGSLQALYDAGARGLLMRFETSNIDLYERLHPGQSFEERISHIKAAHAMGYMIITGGIIGLPGQSDDDIINDILLARELNAEMYSFGPFIPAEGTPLGHFGKVSTEMILKVLALTRLVDPENAKILVTTAFETCDSRARERGLMAGANSVMLNVTPRNYREAYSIYPERAHSRESVEDQIDATLSLLKGLGRAPTDLG